MNEDLIGYKFIDEFGHTLEVTGAAFGDYLHCETVERNYRTVRAAGLLLALIRDWTDELHKRRRPLWKKPHKNQARVVKDRLKRKRMRRWTDDEL